VVEGVATGKEYLGELVIVICHHGWAGRLFGHNEKVVDILDGAECLLPELELDGGVELGKVGVEMVLEDVQVG